MKKWLKRIGGAAGLGLAWAVPWSGVGGILEMTMGVVGGIDPSHLALFFLEGAMRGAIAGFVGGSAFSVVLGLAKGRRSFDEMSLPRFAGLGALGGLLLFSLAMLLLRASVGFLFTLEAAVLASVMSLLGAGCASGTLALARKAEDRELLEAGADVADIGLTEAERHELLAK